MAWGLGPCIARLGSRAEVWRLGALKRAPTDARACPKTDRYLPIRSCGPLAVWSRCFRRDLRLLAATPLLHLQELEERMQNRQRVWLAALRTRKATKLWKVTAEQVPCL